MKIFLFSMIILFSITMSANISAYQEIDIELSDVPANVIQAAKNAKPGIKLTEAERINDDGKVRYELEGNLVKEQFEFLISEEGILIEMELEDD